MNYDSPFRYLYGHVACEMATHLDAMANELESIERAAFQRRMLPALELESITMRREMACVRGLDQ